MPLTFVLPVSQGDIDRLGPTLEAMEFLGGLQKHAVLFCAAPSVQARVAEMASRLRSVCPNVMVECLPREPEPVGPFGAFNAIFRDSVEIVERRNQSPWMWWEADVTPIRGGWADRLELEYHQKGQPFMGVRRKAAEVMRNLDGAALPDNDPRAQGDYMVAVGIYPPNFKDYSTMYKYPDPSGRMPTDVNIRHEINRHLHHTELIGHHWNTANYTRNAQGRIVCEDVKAQPGYPSYGGEVSEMSFVVHGCKDGSLARLILSETPSNVSALPVSINTSGDGELVALRLENEAMRADMARKTQQWSAKENAYAQEIEDLKERLDGFSSDRKAPTEDMKDAAAAAWYESALMPRIMKVLPEVGNLLPLSKLAVKLGTKKDVVKAAVEKSDKFSIGGAPECVERVAA